MQGQRSAIGSLPDSINLDYGSPTSNVNVDQQICWNSLRNPSETRLSDTFTGSVIEEGRNFNRWSIGESSSSNPQNMGGYNDRITQSGWHSSMDGSLLRLEEERYEPTNFVSNTGFNLNISSNPVVVGPSLASQNNDLDDVNFPRVGNDMDPPNFLSRTSGSLSEEDEGRPGCSVNVRRHSCKRKTLEGNAGQSSSSGSCFSMSAECLTWHVGPTRHDSGGSSSFESVNPRLGLGIGGVQADSVSPMSSTPGSQDTSQRSYRLRVNPSIQQDSMPNNSLSSAPSGARGPDILTSHQPLRYVPLSPPLDLMSSIPSGSSVPQSQPLILRVPTLRRNVHSHRLNGALNVMPGSSSSSTPSSERNNTVLPEDWNSRNTSRNITENPLFTPPVERNPAQSSTRWSANSDNVSGVSRNINPSNARAAPGPSWAPHRHPSSQYSRRLSEYVRRSLLSTVGSENGGQRSNSQIRSSLQEGMPSGSGNEGRNARPAFWIERQGEGALGMPYSLRSLATAGEGRSRLVSELRNVLDIMRRGEGLRLEDVMILDQSMFFGMADVHDQHRDMRLDVDNMSYEELLALEERIGDVCTGLSEETILNRMKQHKYIHTMSDHHIETEPCCICQEEYSDGEGIGTLDCGHDFHSECIKQWLAHKNLCPICKTTGLKT